MENSMENSMASIINEHKRNGPLDTISQKVSYVYHDSDHLLNGFRSCSFIVDPLVFDLHARI